MNKTATRLSIGLLCIVAGSAFARPPHLQQIDSDQDGSISRAEVESHAATQAQDTDINGDGLITLEELQAAHERRRQQKMQARLDQADSNQDGQIGVDEFSAQIVERVMRRDRNGDGVVDQADRPARGERPMRPARR